MTTLRVHFDGRVLVPEGPVDLPVGESIEVVLQDPPRAQDSPPQLRGPRFGVRNGVPIILPSPGAPDVTPEDIERAEDEDGL